MSSRGARRLGHSPRDGSDGAALVRFGRDDAAEEWDLHAVGGQTRHIVSRGDILRIHQAMWAVKEGVHKFQRHGVVVHLFQKVLDEVWVVVELVGADTLHVLLVVALFFEEQPSEVLCQDEGCIVARGEHAAVEQLLSRKDVSLFKFGGRASYV